jgi:hypothetical protein
LDATDVQQREDLRSLIGPQAEWLAYVFCVSDRRFCEALVMSEKPIVHDRHGGAITLTQRQATELLIIEVANLLEQNVAGRGGPSSLRRLLMCPALPAAVRAEVEAEVGS